MEDTLYPHEKRMKLVAKDGRPFWREYFPGCVDTGSPDKSSFISSPAEIETYLSERQGRVIHIYFEKDKAYEPECFVMTCRVVLNENEVEEETKHFVMGFGQNIPQKWFEEYTEDRCKKLSTKEQKEARHKNV